MSKVRVPAKQHFTCDRCNDTATINTVEEEKAIRAEGSYHHHDPIKELPAYWGRLDLSTYNFPKPAEKHLCKRCLDSFHNWINRVDILPTTIEMPLDDTLKEQAE